MDPPGKNPARVLYPGRNVDCNPDMPAGGADAKKGRPKSGRPPVVRGESRGFQFGEAWTIPTISRALSISFTSRARASS